MYYHFRVHKEGAGYWAECVELEGCQTQADSKDELGANMQEALNLYLDESWDSKAVFPLPKRSVKGRGIERVPVDPGVGLAFLLRRSRTRHHMTQTEVSRRLGFKNVYSYQRLESGRTANPELRTLIKVKSIFPELELNQIL